MRLLARALAAELAQQLGPTQFAQVHHSTIVTLSPVVGTRRDETR